MKHVFSIILILPICFAGCKKDDEMITSLEITIIDEDGIPVTDVNVELYPSLNDWINESNAIFPQMQTDLDGKITYMNIDTGTYYINAIRDSLNNWEEGVVKSVIEGFRNTTDITITESLSSILSKASGKKWILNSYFTNGADSYEFLDECVKDDTLVFYKGPRTGAYLISRGTLKCTQNQDDSIPGLWTILNDGNQLRIQLGNDIINWNIDTLKVENLSVTYVETGNIQNAIYGPVEE